MIEMMILNLILEINNINLGIMINNNIISNIKMMHILRKATWDTIVKTTSNMILICRLKKISID